MKRTCDACGGGYEGSKRSRFCDRAECKRLRARARKQAQRGGNVVEFPAEPESGQGSVHEATLRELTVAGMVDTTVGQSALALAKQLDWGVLDTGSSKAAVARQLQALMADAMKDVKVADDPVDELRAARERRRRGA